MTQTINLTWDGEKIKQSVEVDEVKLTPKDILNQLDHVRNQIEQMKGDIAKAKGHIKQTKGNIESAEIYEKDYAALEDRCLEIQEEKLKLYISQIKDECIKKALKQSVEIFEKDPNAYTEDQANNLKYVNYQRLLATDKKIAENISSRVITNMLYDKPIFENPFV